MERIETCCHAFLLNVKGALKSPGVDACVHIPFNLDVWRYLSKGKGSAAGQWFLFEMADFGKFISLPDHWYYYLNEHGTGRAVDFPMKIRPYLAKSCKKDYSAGVTDSDIVKAPTLYCEKVAFYFVKKACNKYNVH